MSDNVKNTNYISPKDEYAIKVERASLEAYKEQLENLPTAQPETTSVTVGRTKGETTLWYECDHCGMPVTTGDCFCANCGRKLVWKI